MNKHAMALAVPARNGNPAAEEANNDVPVGLLVSDASLTADLEPDVAGVLRLVLGDPLAAADAIAALRRYSLITPAGDGAVLVHRLVQAITLSEMPAGVVGHLKQAAMALVEAAIPADTRLRASWSACAVLLPHAQAVLSLTSRQRRGTCTPPCCLCSSACSAPSTRTP